MFQRILIANRGEIALRVIRACRDLGIEVVAVFSEADRGAAYLALADEAICIGPASPAESYLNIPRIISAAEISDVQAIHPGYGFLAENPHFAEVCRSCNIEFIGPPHEAMRRLGNKNEARKLAQEVGVPIVPGSEGLVQNDADALKLAHDMSFPVLIKAAAGGGGRGMRVARNDISFQAGLKAARQEAEKAFKDGSVYLEKYIEFARHIEVQILADRHGNVVHLWERDCSLQRRHQHRFYFIEVNARIQVEHPVTELVTGIDLVREQIRIAAGEPLRFKQEDISHRGVALECRINAEDPAEDFRPSPGVVTKWQPPGGPGVRLDTHVVAGYQVPPNYDSLLAKLIVYQPTRTEALATMRRALAEFIIEGVKTTIPLHREVLNHSSFVEGQVDTTFIERNWGKGQ